MQPQIITIFNENEFRQLLISCMKEVVGQDKTPTTDLTQNSLLTIEQAASYLNLAKQTLYGYTSQRLIPFLKRGKKLYFEPEALDAWLQEGKKQTQAEIAASVGLKQKGGKNGK